MWPLWPDPRVANYLTSVKMIRSGVFLFLTVSGARFFELGLNSRKNSGGDFSAGGVAVSAPPRTSRSILAAAEYKLILNTKAKFLNLRPQRNYTCGF